MNYLQYLTIYPQLPELAVKDRRQAVAMAKIEHQAALAVLRSLQDGIKENADRQAAGEFLKTFIQESMLQLEAAKETIAIYQQEHSDEQAGKPHSLESH